MIGLRDDNELLRLDGADEEAEATRAPDPDATGSVSLAVVTIDDGDGHYPTVGGRFHKCQVLSVLGTESIGSTGTTTPQAGSYIFVLNLGSLPPPPGRQLLATFVPHRFVMEF